MSHDSPDKVTVTKLDAAKRQLDTAIDLWFREGDPVSIHTLTGAARRILLNLAEHQGKSLGLFDTRHIRPGKEKEYKKHLRALETFFKHAENDPNATVSFNPEATEGYLLDAIESFFDLSTKRTLLMQAFRIRFFTFHPEIFSENSPPESVQSAQIQLRSLSRGDYLKVFLSNLKSLDRS